MSLTLISSPEKTVNGLLSNVNGALSQLPYKFLRQDNIIRRISDISDELIAAINIPNLEADYPDGSIAYFYFPDGNVKSGIYTIRTSSTSGTETLLYLTIPYTDGQHIFPVDTAYVNNLTTHQNYKVNIEILEKTGTTKLIDLTFKYSTKPNGELFLDVGRILTTYQRENEKISLEYVLRYKPTYEGSTEDWVNTPIIQSILASKQLLDVGGSNMWENLLRDETTPTPAGDAKLLTKFTSAGTKETTVGTHDTFTFTSVTPIAPYNDKVGLRYNGSLLDPSIAYKVGEQLHVVFEDPSTPPGTTYVTGDYTIIEVVFGGADWWVVLDYTYTLPIGNGSAVYDDSTTKTIAVIGSDPLMWRGWKRTVSALVDANYNARTGFTTAKINPLGFDINKGFVGSYSAIIISTSPNIKTGVIPEGTEYYTSIDVRGDDNKQESERLYYKVLDPCKNPIMVEWRNSLGALEQHLFTLDTLFNRNVTEGLTGQKAIEDDIENVARTQERLPLHWYQEAILSEENLSFDQVKALEEIKSSSEVSIFLDQQGTKKIYVIVNNLFASETNNNDTTFDISVQIKFPNNFDFETAKLY